MGRVAAYDAACAASQAGFVDEMVKEDQEARNAAIKVGFDDPAAVAHFMALDAKHLPRVKGLFELNFPDIWYRCAPYLAPSSVGLGVAEPPPRTFSPMALPHDKLDGPPERRGAAVGFRDGFLRTFDVVDHAGARLGERERGHRNLRLDES